MNSNDSFLRISSSDGPKYVRLVCFAHAGAGASSFNSWVTLLPAWIELVRVQLPGREDRTNVPPLTDLKSLIFALVKEYECLERKPLIVYGHCLGALIAFEFCRAILPKESSAPIALFVSGRRAPHIPSSLTLHDLPEDQLIEALEQMGAGSPLLHNSRWRRYYIDTIRSDLKLTDQYQFEPGPALICALHLFAGKNDPRNEEHGWCDQSLGAYHKHVVDGGHFFTRTGTEELIRVLVATFLQRFSPSLVPDADTRLVSPPQCLLMPYE